MGPSEQSGTIEGEVGVLNTSGSANPEDRLESVIIIEKTLILCCPIQLRICKCSKCVHTPMYIHLYKHNV